MKSVISEVKRFSIKDLPCLMVHIDDGELIVLVVGGEMGEYKLTNLHVPSDCNTLGDVDVVDEEDLIRHFRPYNGKLTLSNS